MSNRQHKSNKKHAVEQRSLMSVIRKGLIRKSTERIIQRVPCIGGCGTYVLKEQGECHHCRRKRIHAGHRRIVKAERAYVPAMAEIEHRREMMDDWVQETENEKSSD